MSAWLINRLILLMILLFASIMSLIWLKKLDKASKYIALFLLFTFIVETAALWAAYKFRQNNPIYNIAHIIRFTLLSLFFNESIISFKKKKIGVYSIIWGISVALINLIFFQSLYILNTNFLAFESVTIVAMCLYYFYDFLLTDTYLKQLPIHFWFVSLLLIFWSFTLFHWLVGFYIMYAQNNMSDWTYNIIVVVNMLTYLSFGILFFNYRKMSKVD